MSVRKIAISGLEKNERVILKAAIQTASGFETGPWEFSENLSTAQAVILDQNDPEGSRIIESYSGKEDAPLLVGIIDTDSKQLKELRFMIAKPFNYNSVLAALRQIESRVKNPVGEELAAEVSEQKKVSKNPGRKEQDSLKTTTENVVEIEDITEGENEELEDKIPEVSEVVVVDKKQQPDKARLHHIIKEIISENKSVEISHPDFPSIKICTEKNWFIFSGDLDQQSDLFRTELNEFTVEEKGDEIRKEAFSGAFPKALWELVYTATLFGCEGELQAQLMPGDKLYLTERPDFKLIPHNGQHIAIADYLASHSAMVDEVASNLDIELSTVNEFCNACQSIGLLIATGAPQNRLFLLINRIIEKKKSVEITHPNFPTIDICSEKDWFIFPEDLKKHSEMFCVDVGEFSFENRGDEIRKQAFAGSFPKKLWELVYTATMYGTEGKLLAPLHATDRLSLIAKPDFDYVNHTEEQVVLADYMVSHSDTVHDIAINTGIDLENIIDFSNMCQAVNLIERNIEVSAAPPLEDEGDKRMERKIEKAESKTSKFIHSLFSGSGKKT